MPIGSLFYRCASSHKKVSLKKNPHPSLKIKGIFTIVPNARVELKHHRRAEAFRRGVKLNYPLQIFVFLLTVLLTFPPTIFGDSKLMPGFFNDPPPLHYPF